jgi:outer membrane protein
MHYLSCTFITTVWLGIFTAQGQVDSTAGKINVFSLNDCVSYALQHQRDVVNARLDKQYAQEQIKENTGKLLPHAVVTAGFQDNLKLQTSLIPDIASGNYDRKIPVQFGTRYASNVLGQVNQTVFNSDYFLGLKASKVYGSLATKALQRTEIDIRVGVAKAYYAVLVNEENIRLAAANGAQLKKTMEDTRSRYDAGVAERVDVDRITVSYNNVATEIENLHRLVAYTRELLKFQMGMPSGDSLALSQSVNDFSPQQAVDTLDYHIQDRVEYGQQLTQIELNKLSLRSTKNQYLPSLSAYINYGFNYFSEKFGDLYKRGFGASTLGLSLTWDLFTGTERLHRVKEDQITLRKSENDLAWLSQQIQLDVKNAYTQYQNNMALLRTQQTNMQLTQGVYDRIVLKYNQGVASSLDLISAESELKQSQSDYINALLNALITKVDLDKAMGKIR